jgi:SAM-dependent methyltransferase
MGWKRNVRHGLNAVLSVADLELVRRGTWSSSANPAVKDFLAFKATLAAAKQAGLSVGDYIDSQHAKPGATQQTIDKMGELGVFDGKCDRICEIGPGSGRYLEKTLARCRPAHYEIYETAPEWRDWLVKQYPVIARPADGQSLAPTPTASVDLVHAHKVFVYLPFLTSCRYFIEMARVVRPGGHVVFDIITEECMDDETLQEWLRSGIDFPCFMGRQFAIRNLTSKGLSLVGSFFIPLPVGRTECLVFIRRP